MFDFQKLNVYQKSKEFCRDNQDFLCDSKIPRHIKDQFKRASFSIVLNIAEGTGRFTSPDKRNFFVIARGSVFECVAIIDYLKWTGLLPNDQFQQMYAQLEELSRMLFAMIKSFS